MFSEWLFRKVKKIGFEDIKHIINNPNEKYIIINTLPINLQNGLIKNTVPSHKEETIINQLLENYEMKKVHIVVYGKNSVDETVDQKYKQLYDLGFSQVYLYSGGLFEWLLLQDIYGADEFPTHGKIMDILELKPSKLL